MLLITFKIASMRIPNGIKSFWIPNTANEFASSLSLNCVFSYQIINYVKEVNCCGCTNKNKMLEQQPLFKGTSEGCGPYKGNTFRFSLEVPTTQATDTSICKAMKVSYLIRVS